MKDSFVEKVDYKANEVRLYGRKNSVLYRQIDDSLANRQRSIDLCHFFNKAMKGLYSDMLWKLAIILLSFVVAFMLWNTFVNQAPKQGISAMERAFGGIAGIAAFARARARKGIVLSTMMIATIIFVVVVGLVLFLVFAGLQANAGNTASGFFYGAFDAIMHMLPGAG